MNSNDFNEAVKEQMAKSLRMLVGKGEEYAGNSSDDRLSHFKAAAALMQVSPRMALMGMASKHFASVGKMCTSGEEYPIELWDEKITDSVNYLLILSAMVREER